MYKRQVFNAYTDADGWAVWATDGTPQGTVLLKRMANAPYAFVRVGNRALFAGPTVFSIWSLWRTDGTVPGTKPFKSMFLSTVFPARTASLNGEIYFGGRLGGSDTELWKTDGTEAGTVLVKDIQPGSGGSEPENAIRVGDFIYFSADDGVTGRELWRSDGTEAGTVRLTDLNACLLYTSPSPRD